MFQLLFRVFILEKTNTVFELKMTRWQRIRFSHVWSSLILYCWNLCKITFIFCELLLRWMSSRTFLGKKFNDMFAGCWHVCVFNSNVCLELFIHAIMKYQFNLNLSIQISHFLKGFRGDTATYVSEVQCIILYYRFQASRHVPIANTVWAIFLLLRMLKKHCSFSVGKHWK